jgi:hypothetical protein
VELKNIEQAPSPQEGEIKTDDKKGESAELRE